MRGGIGVELKEVFSLEKEAISLTICDYTVDNFILSYSKQLKHLSLPEDYERIATIVKRLTEWYKLNINGINNSQFILNKEEHNKSMSLLIEFRDKLNHFNIAG